MAPRTGRRHRCGCALVILWALHGLSVGAIADPYISLGLSDGIALDQPRVAVAVVHPTTGQVLGPEFFNEFLLDTGATGIVIGGNAYNELQDAGYQTVAQYEEQGVAGTTTMDVSRLYDFNFAGFDGEPIERPNVRLMSNPTLEVGFSGIVGMPAMVNRRTTMDMTVWSGGNFDTMQTSFANSAPAPVVGQFHVPLALVDFPLSGLQHPNDPPPTFAPLPTAPVVLNHGGRSTYAQFIVDTGAQLSIISTATAAKLGIDPDVDAIDYLEVGGIGGTVLMPVVNTDELSLLTTEGVKLNWTGLQVGVLDIDESIAGIFGMDFLTTGWLNALFGGSDGAFNRVHFDFRNAASHTGSMVLDIGADWNHIVVPGDVNHDGLVNLTDVQVVGLHWQQFSSTGDATGDGFVDLRDVQAVGLDWGFVPPTWGAATAVPEPTSWSLAIVAALLLVTLRRRS